MILMNHWREHGECGTLRVDRADARARTAGRVHSVRRHRVGRMITLAVQYVPARPARRSA
jgi:hypothetical protein